MNPATTDSSQFWEQLETFPNPHPHRDYLIETICPEFTSMCPMSGQPDFGTLTIFYRPGQKCFELKSLKLYLQLYRNVGAFYEDVTNRIFTDIPKVIEGGLNSNPARTYLNSGGGRMGALIKSDGGRNRGLRGAKPPAMELARVRGEPLQITAIGSTISI